MLDMIKVDISESFQMYEAVAWEWTFLLMQMLCQQQ